MQLHQALQIQYPPLIPTSYDLNQICPNGQ
jgi:hypothetical protein